jgi:hypothetical protein
VLDIDAAEDRTFAGSRTQNIRIKYGNSISHGSSSQGLNGQFLLWKHVWGPHAYTASTSKLVTGSVLRCDFNLYVKCINITKILIIYN